MKLKQQNSKNNNKYSNSYLKEDFDMVKILNQNLFKKKFECSFFFLKNLNKWNSSKKMVLIKFNEPLFRINDFD